MPQNRWLVQLSTGIFIAGGFFEPPEVQDADHLIVTLTTEVMPDLRMQRYDGNGGVRLATTAEISTYDAAQSDAATAQEDTSLLDLVLDNFDAMSKASQAGTFDHAHWHATLYAEHMRRRRSQKGL